MIGSGQIRTFLILTMLLVGTAIVCTANETYSWTDDNDVVNFTDNPAQVPREHRTLPIAEAELQPQLQSEDIVGYWSNEQNEFKTLNCMIKQDNSGVMITAIGLQLPFSWRLMADGRLEMVFSEIDQGDRRSATARSGSARLNTIQAEYDREKETIQFGNEGSGRVVLYRVENPDYKAKKRKDFKRKQIYVTERIVLSDLTVLDVVTGLIWTRDASLTPNGEVVSHDYAKRLIADLNRQNYGGYNDWRLPSLEELQDFTRFGKGFYHETSPKNNSKNWGVASVFNGMGFIGVKPFFYWTSTRHEGFKDNFYCVSLINGMDTYNIDYYTRHVWPVRRAR